MKQVTGLCLVSALLAAGCLSATPAPIPTHSLPPTATATATATPPPLPPLLEPASKLARRCEEQRGFAARPMVPGELAVDFTLKDAKGKDYTLSNLLAEKPVIMIFGSFT